MRDGRSLGEWVGDVIAHGSGRSDAILVCAAYRATDPSQLEEIAAVARAFAPARERLLETQAQGAAFAATVRAVWSLDVADAPYPVAYGQACAGMALPLAPALALYLHAMAANLVSSAQRAMPLGQAEAQACLAPLAPLTRRVARDALTEGLDDLSGCAFLAEIAAMRHETLDVRIFRT